LNSAPAADARFVVSGAMASRERFFPKAMHLTPHRHTDEWRAASVDHGFRCARWFRMVWHGLDQMAARVDLLSAPKRSRLPQAVRSLLAECALRTGHHDAGEVRILAARDGAILSAPAFVVRERVGRREPRPQVEVSTDGGKKWTAARLDSEASPYAWICWSYIGESFRRRVHLSVRATDDQGHRNRSSALPNGRRLRVERPATIRVTVK